MASAPGTSAGTAPGTSAGTGAGSAIPMPKGITVTKPPPPSRMVPARAKLEVQKNVAAFSQPVPPVKTKALGEAEKQDEVFGATMEIALALLPTVAFVHAKFARSWIKKLLEPTLPRNKRNAYLSYLVFQMQNFNLKEPFDREPPHSIADAAKLFSSAKLKVLMEEMEKKDLMECLRENLTPHGLSSFRADFKPPTEFFDDQPQPINGVIAYGSCFSNHFR